MRGTRTVGLVGVALSCATAAPAQSRTSAAGATEVGPNVRVNADLTRPYREVHVTADPTNPDRLAVCAMVGRTASYSVVAGGEVNTVLFASYDGGRTWTVAVEDSVPTRLGPDGTRRTSSSWDPTCEYGPDGMLYFGTGTSVWGLPRERVIRVHRSGDGGRTWLAPALVGDPPIYDKFWLTTDTRPTSPLRGQVYLVYYAAVPGDAGAIRGTLMASSDRGGTFRPIGGFPDSSLPGPYGGVALGDGTVVLTDQHSALAVLVGRPDSQRFTRPIVPEAHEVEPGADSPSLAVDASNGPFRDRVYKVWVVREGQYGHIVVSYSTDRGGAWSAPRIVSDLPLGDSTDVSGNRYPTVAVNGVGVVGVSWYHMSPGVLGAERAEVRFRASLDGGDTWRPSVRVSERAAGPFHLSDARAPLPLWPQDPGTTLDTVSGSLRLALARNLGGGAPGDYAGLAATADGVFHAGWAAEHNGVRQVWTAPIRVRGRVGIDPALATLREVTRRVNVVFEDVLFHPAGGKSGRLVGTVVVVNRSADTLRAPLRLQASALEKGLVTGLWTESRSGLALDRRHRSWLGEAVWDVSAGLPGGVLPPGATSQPVPIAFTVPRLIDGYSILLPLRLRLFAADQAAAVSSEASAPPARR